MKYIPEIDGLRAICITLILCQHAELPYNDHLYVGVAMFFVLSGFLITQILLGSLNQDGFFRVFYLRRALRILPAYYVSLLLGFAVYTVSSRPLNADDLGWISAASFFYTNYYQDSSLYCNIWTLGPTWSLAVEEQFYLVYPWLIYAVGRSRYLLTILAGLALGSLACRPVVINQGDHLITNYVSLQTNALSLLMGAMACLAANREAVLRWFQRWAPLVMAATAGYIGYCNIGQHLDFFHSEVGDRNWLLLDLCGSLFATACLLHIKTSGDSLLKALLRNRLFVYLGKRSYSLYLTHIATYILVAYTYNALFPPMTATWMYVLFAGFQMLCAVIVAEGMRRYIELPFLRLKDRITYTKSTMA